jgi:tRNA A-37 threonylcarbamoyl transferase component Bud32
MPDASPDPLIGRQLRDLRIVQLVGRGGMGAVYRAEHLLLHEPRAVKVIRKESIGLPDAALRFQREARIAVRLRHPNLVLVHDFFIEDGDYFLVMEYVQGESLGMRIRRTGPLDAQFACRLGIRCCAGLAHAHEMGIVHRDLSPENILLTPTSLGLEPRIIDFGIARAAFAPQADGDDTAATITREGSFVGKPRYASPEQAGRLRRGEVLDARSDLYTFGVILYEMVTADLPFHSDSEIGYLSLHYATLPERPSVIRPDLAIPPALEHVILRCLLKDREARFQSAAELAHALEQVLQEVGPDTRPASRARGARLPRADAATRVLGADLDEAETVVARPRSRAVPLLTAAVGVLGAAVLALAFLLTRSTGGPEVAPELAATPEVPVAARVDTAEEEPADVAPLSEPEPASAPDDGSSPAGGALSASAPRSGASAPPSGASAPPSKASAALASPATPAAVPPGDPDLPALPASGAERYTMVNLHPRGDFLSTVNYQYAGLIPLCTRVRIDARSRNRLSFTVLRGGARYEYNYHRSAGSFDADIARVFGTTCNRGRARQLPALDQQGIRSGQALPGMTKDGVILAIGYPPPHRTPSLQSDAWRYWVGRSATMLVQFRDGRVVRIER